jgi:glycosyltransferase involved in cell wall biosynthesis
LAAAAFKLVDAKTRTPLLDGLAARLLEADWAALLGTVVEAQARGPEGPRAAAWRRLYVAGCPIDNIHRTLWHAFQDPEADIQDWTWLPREAAMANLERYVQLEFPRVGSMRYGVGLGCETLLANATGAFRELVRLGSSHIFLGQTLNLCRNVLSPALRARVDARAALHAPVTESIDKEPWQEELLELEEVDELVLQRWLDALNEMRKTGAAVHDRSADRFALAGETLAPRRIRPRPAPEAPAARTAQVAPRAPAGRARALATRGDVGFDRRRRPAGVARLGRRQRLRSTARLNHRTQHHARERSQAARRTPSWSNRVSSTSRGWVSERLLGRKFVSPLLDRVLDGGESWRDGSFMSEWNRHRVSVVMTVFNSTSFLGEAIESVLAQEEPDVELLIVDDGSTEDVRAALRPYEGKHRYIRRENGGLGAARNTGLEAARGEFIAFCDSDDVHLPFRLSAHAACLAQAPRAAQVFSDLRTWDGGRITVESTLRDSTRSLGPVRGTFDEAVARCFAAPQRASELGVRLPPEFADRNVFRGHVPQLIAVDHIAWGGASMFRRDALIAVGGHDPALRRWPDWGLASKLSKSYELVFLDVPVLLYRQHGAQLTKQQDVGSRCYFHVAQTVWLNDPVFCAQFPDERDRLTHEATLRMAGVHVRAGEWAEAKALLARAIRANPQSRGAYTAWLRSSFMLQLGRVRKPRAA